MEKSGLRPNRITKVESNFLKDFKNYFNTILTKIVSNDNCKAFQNNSTDLKDLILHFMRENLFKCFLLTKVSNGNHFDFKTLQSIEIPTSKFAPYVCNKFPHKIANNKLNQKLTKDLFKQFYQNYSYSTDEELSKQYNAPLKQKDVINPSIFGKINELFLKGHEKESTGTFYTPDAEVKLMVDLSISQFLSNENIVPSHSDALDLVFFTKTKDKLTARAKQHKIDRYQTNKISKSLQDIKVLDPACGSGAFLVIFAETLFQCIKNSLTKKNGDDDFYLIKKNIITKCLFGIDIKWWAIRSTQYRLILWLIKDKFFDKNLLNNLLMIPQLDINFFLGDYLLTTSLCHRVRKKLHTHLSQIRIEISDALNTLYTCIDNAIDNNQSVQGVLENREALFNYIINYLGETALQTQNDFQPLESYFCEIFIENDGFDVIIGNPPYISHLHISKPFISGNSGIKGNSTVENSKNYKNALYKKMKSQWTNTYVKDGNSDYLTYFYYQSLFLLKPGGINSFLSSKSWLEADYGVKLQQFLVKQANINYVIDSKTNRTFKAAINTVITIVSKRKLLDAKKRQKTSFLLLKMSYDKFIQQPTDLLIKILISLKSIETEFIQKNAVELSKNNLRWMYYFYPKELIRLLTHDKLVPLKEFFNISRGITTGANNFFYTNDPNVLEDQYLIPTIKSSKEIDSIKLSPDTITNYLIKLPKKNAKLSRKAKEYIKKGRKQEILIKRGRLRGKTIIGYQNTPMLSSKKNWYSINYKIGDIILFKHIYQRFIAVININSQFCINNVLYNLKLKKSNFSNPKKAIKAFTALLNSTLTWMLVEMSAQSNLGEGAIVMNLSIIKELLTPNLLELEQNQIHRLIKIFETLSNRKIGNYSNELGIQNSEKKFSLRQIKSDRLQLDNIVFQEILGFTPKDQLVLYNNFIETFIGRTKKKQT